MPPGLDHDRVGDWLMSNVGGLEAPFEMTVARGGHSNITCFVGDANGRRVVVRRPPLGDLPPGTHNVVREHGVLTALLPTGVPVPHPLGLCLDRSITGAPFYVMEWVDGCVIATPDDVAAHLPDRTSRHAAADALVDTLAELHRIDPDAVGLGSLGRSDDPLGHQLGRMREVWNCTRTRELPLMEEVADRLIASRPPTRRTGIVHGDFRFANMLFGYDGAVASVLDWELCTVGDFLTDVAFLLANWQLPDDGIPQVWMVPPPTRAGGFPDAEYVLERYASKTGDDLADIEYYRAFAYWRIAVIAEGIKRRAEARAHAGDGGCVDDHLARRVVDLAELAQGHLR